MTSGLRWWSTRSGARDPALYREVVDRIRSAATDVVINLTTGMGGDLVLGGVERPLPPANQGTDMAGATERLAHIADCLPEIATLDYRRPIYTAISTAPYGCRPFSSWPNSRA